MWTIEEINDGLRQIHPTMRYLELPHDGMSIGVFRVDADQPVEDNALIVDPAQRAAWVAERVCEFMRSQHEREQVAA